MQRYHVDPSQARRVSKLAQNLYAKLTANERDPDDSAATRLGWAGKLHEIGISVAYSGYQKHSAYILEKADMPGFSRDEQLQLGLLVLAHRRSLRKTLPRLDGVVDWKSVLALRLAALFYRGRADVALPAIEVKANGTRFQLVLDNGWLGRNPLTATALREEIEEWEKIGFDLRVPGLEQIETAEASVTEE
jgi:exopolyphosphatase/guanosine-5'-triphosphate,3'-diphosphate pyrophosphatase